MLWFPDAALHFPTVLYLHISACMHEVRGRPYPCRDMDGSALHQCAWKHTNRVFHIEGSVRGVFTITAVLLNEVYACLIFLIILLVLI